MWVASTDFMETLSMSGEKGGGLEVADGLQRAVHLQLEVVELADGSEEGVRLETDLLVQTHLHQVQIPRELRGKGWGDSHFVVHHLEVLVGIQHHAEHHWIRELEFLVEEDLPVNNVLGCSLEAQSRSTVSIRSHSLPHSSPASYPALPVFPMPAILLVTAG